MLFVTVKEKKRQTHVSLLQLLAKVLKIEQIFIEIYGSVFLGGKLIFKRFSPTTKRTKTIYSLTDNKLYFCGVSSIFFKKLLGTAAVQGAYS